jgi:hypothetical protein
MKRLLVAAALLAGCSESGVGPKASETLSIHLESEGIREAAVAVGDSIRLTAGMSDGGPGESAVVWTIEDPTIASLRGATSTAVMVYGEAFGSTRVVAMAGALADTVVISVLAAGAGGWCDNGGLELGIGQSLTTTAAAASPLCLAAAGANGAEFVVVPFNASVGGQRLRVEVTADGIVAPSALFPDTEGSMEPLSSGAEVATEFDRRLREREARELRGMVTGFGAPSAAASVAAAETLKVGDTIRLNVNSTSTCGSPIERTARVTALGQRSVMLEDTSNPAGGFSTSDYESFAAAFDQRVYPTLTTNFGNPTDTDGNGRILILFTKAVNELTSTGSEAFVAGFFFARDLFPIRDENGLKGCATSNAAELLYMLVPDPGGVVNGNVRTREDVAARTVGIMGHELQHLISASRRLRVLRVTDWSEEFWLNEALSHIAEELLFYATTGFEPREEITITRLRGALGGIPRFNEFQVANFGRYSTYLRDPANASPMIGADLATRGAGWAFLRYAADRYPGVEADLWRKLIDSDETGYSNLLSALESSPLAWMHDWAVALYVDDFVFSLPLRFRQRSWNFRSIMPAISSNAGQYPLAVAELRPTTGGRAELELVASGTAIVRLRAGELDAPRIRITSGGATAPPQLRFTIVRTR